MLDGIMNGLTGKEEGVAQSGEHNHQYGSENCKLGSKTEKRVTIKLTWMERGCLAERQERISKPNLHHEPGDRLEGPFLRSRSEGPESKEHPGETDGRNANEKDKFGCHRLERATNVIVGRTSDNEGRRTYSTTTLFLTKKNASLNSS
jgi:hypothetical protein